MIVWIAQTDTSEREIVVRVFDGLIFEDMNMTEKTRQRRQSTVTSGRHRSLLDVDVLGKAIGFAQ
jgi:hypothetical protein